jgi:hypothetical protein
MCARWQRRISARKTSPAELSSERVTDVLSLRGNGVRILAVELEKLAPANLYENFLRKRSVFMRFLRMPT